MRIGLLGGSFNPAHAGHRHIIELARRRLRLDQVWLLVSPGNPLKPQCGMAPFAQRLASARAHRRRPPRHRQRDRGGVRHALHDRHAAPPAAALSAGAVRLADGRRHPGAVAALAPLAGVRAPCAVRGAAAARLQSPRTGRPGRAPAAPVRDGRTRSASVLDRMRRARLGISAACRRTPPRPPRSAPAEGAMP